MLYLLVYTNKPDSEDLREKFVNEHRAFRRGLEEAGKLKVAGPRFDGDEGPSSGSLVIMEADSLGQAKEIVSQDPYLTEGVFTLDSISRINPRCWKMIEIS